MDSIDALEKIAGLLMGPGGAVVLLIIVVVFQQRRLNKIETENDRLLKLNQDRMDRIEQKLFSILERTGERLPTRLGERDP